MTAYPSIGHNNGPTLKNEDGALIELLFAQRDALARLLQDRRMGHQHGVILAQIVLLSNMNSGLSAPGRKAIALATGYSESTVASAISDLIERGYITGQRRAPAEGSRPITHYTVPRPTREQLEDAISDHIATLRRRRSPPNVGKVDNVVSPDVAKRLNVVRSNFAPNVGKVDPNVAKDGNVASVVTLPRMPTLEVPHIDNNNYSSLETLTTVESSNSCVDDLFGVASKTKKETKRAIPLPRDWVLPQSLRLKFRTKDKLSDGQIDDIVFDFTGHWWNKDPRLASSKKMDWDLACDVWARNAVKKYGLKPAGASSQPGASVPESAQDRKDRIAMGDKYPEYLRLKAEREKLNG